MSNNKENAIIQWKVVSVTSWAKPVTVPGSPEGCRLSVWQLLCCKLDFLFHTHTLKKKKNLIEKGFKAVSAVLHHLMCRQDKMSKPQTCHRLRDVSTALQNTSCHVHVTCLRPDFHICRWSYKWDVGDGVYDGLWWEKPDIFVWSQDVSSLVCSNQNRYF